MHDLFVRIEAENYDAWRRVHDELAPHRREYGIEDGPLYRGIDEPDAVVLFNLGVALEDLGERTDAITAYERALQLDEALADQGIEMITLHRRGRKKTHDGRELRRYKRRWKIERLFAWLGN